MVGTFCRSLSLWVRVYSPNIICCKVDVGSRDGRGVETGIDNRFFRLTMAVAELLCFLVGEQQRVAGRADVWIDSEDGPCALLIS